LKLQDAAQELSRIEFIIQHIEPSNYSKISMSWCRWTKWFNIYWKL